LTYQNISIRRFTAEELQLAALRQLAFEEPVSRLARLKKTAQRQLVRADRDKVKELPLFQLADLHGRIFAPDDIAPRSMILSLAISLAFLLEDFRIYTGTAFSALIASNAHYLCQDFGQSARSAAIIELSQKLARLLDPGPERSRWLTIGLLSTIDWTALVQTQQSGANYLQSQEAGQRQDTAARDNDEAGNDALKFLPSLLDLAGSLIDTLNIDWQRQVPATLETIDCSALYTVATQLAAKVRENLRPSLVVLVEGQSELIVLPHFARLKGAPLESLGALVIASGGAKQVARRYLTMKDVLRIPIVCVFDGDAEDSSVMIEEALRDCDRLCCLEASELEDCYSYEQLLKILNRQLTQTGQTLSSETFDIPREGPRKEALNKLFRSRGLGDFDKIAFAKSTVSLARSKEDVPQEMSKIIDYVAQTSKNSPAFPPKF
jgi:hypothetical protein